MIVGEENSISGLGIPIVNDRRFINNDRFGPRHTNRGGLANHLDGHVATYNAFENPWTNPKYAYE